MSRDRTIKINMTYKEMPETVNAITGYDEKRGQYFTIINESKDAKTQEAAFLHEMKHIYREDFTSGKTAAEIELEAHRIREGADA